MDLASVVAALASVGVRVSGSTPNSSVQVDSSRACPTGLAGPEPSGTINDPGQHFHAYPWGKTAKALPTRGEGWPSVLRAYKTPIFAKGQKLTHSPAHEEKHAGQETPLLYTPYLQWHHPGGRALLQLAQAPTQDYHSYTHALLGGVDEQSRGS